MTEALLALQALEAIRHTAFLKLVAIDNDRAKIAFAICAENSVTAKQRWRELNDEAEHLAEKIVLFDFAIQEARQRATRPDFRQQWRTIVGSEMDI